MLMIALTAAGVAASIGTATSTPNPCTIIPATAISAAFGSTTGTPSTQHDGPSVVIDVCTFKQGSDKLEIDIGPAIAGEGGFGGPATVSKADPSFGSRGHLAYGLTAPYIYATVSFIKGAYYGSIWSNSASASKVEGLATRLYKAL
jgi:hypothetical protein